MACPSSLTRSSAAALTTAAKSALDGRPQGEEEEAEEERKKHKMLRIVKDMMKDRSPGIVVGERERESGKGDVRPVVQAGRL
jgi:hypothetical protein